MKFIRRFVTEFYVVPIRSIRQNFVPATKVIRFKVKFNFWLLVDKVARFVAVRSLALFDVLYESGKVRLARKVIPLCKLSSRLWEACINEMQNALNEIEGGA